MPRVNSHWDDAKKDWIPIATLVAERDRLASILAEIGDAISPTGERPAEALSTLAADVRALASRLDAAHDARPHAEKIAEVRRYLRADTEIAHECDVDGWEPVIESRLRRLEEADSDGWRRSRLIELIAAAEEYLAALDGPARSDNAEGGPTHAPADAGWSPSP